MIYTGNFIRNQIEHWCQLKDNTPRKFARIMGMPRKNSGATITKECQTPVILGFRDFFLFLALDEKLL